MKNLQRAVIATSALLVAGAASAAADVTAITALGADATAFVTAALGVAVIVAGGFWGIKMVKKAFSKAG